MYSVVREISSVHMFITEYLSNPHAKLAPVPNDQFGGKVPVRESDNARPRLVASLGIPVYHPHHIHYTTTTDKAGSNCMTPR